MPGMPSKTVNSDTPPAISAQLQETRFYLGQVEATLKKLEQSGFVVPKPVEATLPRLSPEMEVSVAYWKGRAMEAEQQLKRLKKLGVCGKIDESFSKTDGIKSTFDSIE